MNIEPQNAEARSELHHHVVICVARDAEVLTVLRRFLTGLPCQVHSTDQIDQVLRMLDTMHVNLVLADQQLKAISGTELLQEVARRSPTTARVLLASYPEAHDIIKTEQDTVHGIIGKPWDGQSLQRTIVAILKWQEDRSRLALDTKALPLPVKTPPRRPRPRRPRPPAKQGEEAPDEGGLRKSSNSGENPRSPGSGKVP